MANGNIQENKTLLLLGFTFSSDMKSSDYIESTATSSVRKVGSLCRVRIFFFQSESLMHIYKSVIRPGIKYAFYV